MESGEHSDAVDVKDSKSIIGKACSEGGEYSLHQHTVGQNLNCASKPGEILRNLQNVSYIYRQDTVCSKKSGKIGIVTEVAGDSDSDSSITDDEEDEDSDEVGEVEKNFKAGSNTDVSVEYTSNPDKNVADNSDEGAYNNSHLTADQVRVLWMDESETTENTNDVTVIDRGFLHGDYVAAASDPTGQIGIVVDVNITVDLLAHDGSIVKNIPSKNLKRIREFTVGDHVVLGPWLGRIEDVFDNVTVLLDDGSVCKVMKADPLRLKSVGKNILEDGHFPYYPGQRVKASSSSVFKNSRWLSGLWKANRLEGTVTKVTVGSVFIYWIASAGYGPDSATTPAEEQSPKNLKILSCFAHSNWQLGDWCLFPSSPETSSLPMDKGMSKSESCCNAKDEPESGDESDSEVAIREESNSKNTSVEKDSEDSLNRKSETFENSATAESNLCSIAVSTSKEAAHDTWPLHRKKIRKVVVRKDKKTRKKVENFERALLIINTKTEVDVAWQDGTIQRGMDSISLISIDTPGDHEFVAEQYVVEKSADNTNDVVDIRKVGVVKSVDAKDRTACVRWLKPVARAEDPREFDQEEVVSVYELEGHPDYDYCYGDVVVRLSPVSIPAKMDSMHSIEDKTINKSDESIHDIAQHSGNENTESESAPGMATEFSDLSWVGNITGLRDGDIEVTWADGMISTVGPQAIYVVGRDDDDSVAAGDDAASWETVDDDNAETADNAQEDHRTGDASDIGSAVEDSHAENFGMNGALSIPFAALGFMSRLASGIFSRGRRLSDVKSEDDDLQAHELTLSRDPNGESSSLNLNDIEYQLSKLTTNSKGEEHDASEASDLVEIAETLCSLKQSESIVPQQDESHPKFKGFDIVRDPKDHYFLSAQGQKNASRRWLKKVQQDWDILQNNLPDGIYVRVYEDRMDLLRTAIVGPYGTPYQDGLFFFDFHLPPEYPDVPPSVYYHSGGWRINPNLYEEGKVCLSLLNTWTGRGNEVWDPATSSILQVLVSLQGLVLNSKPYFNEAGYDKQVGTAEGEKNSLSYNENTFLLNCKTMMCLLRKPPKDFQELVNEHFKKRGYYILKACEAYMKGYLIGSLKKDASVSSDDNANSNSMGFKLMLSKVLPKLFSALNEVGADCLDFQHLIKS